MKAILRHLRISPKKVNLIARMVQGMPVQKAVDMLALTPKASARKLSETIQSAAANAENNFKQKREDLVVKTIMVNEGPTLKRYMPVSRGRSYPILKRSSHITVEVGLPEVPKEKSVKKAKMPAQKTDAAPAKKTAPTSKKSTK